MRGIRWKNIIQIKFNVEFSLNFSYLEGMRAAKVFVNIDADDPHYVYETWLYLLIGSAHDKQNRISIQTTCMEFNVQQFHTIS